KDFKKMGEYEITMMNFRFFSGYVTTINDFMITSDDEDAGCYKLISVENGPDTSVNFVVSPNTYFVDHTMVSTGDWITGYYDGNAPVPMIFPPQYGAIVMEKENPYLNVKVAYFVSNLLSSDCHFKLNLFTYDPQYL